MLKSGRSPADLWVMDWSRKAWLLPSLADLFVLFLFLALFARPAAWQSLLADGDTGWHIRTGELILQSCAVPNHDPFSFSRADAPWYAWEWLSDLLFALLHRWHGLAAVAGFSATLLVFSAAVLLIWLLRRGTGFFLALPATFATVSASSVHYLARPHIFTLLFLTLALWLLDEDRQRQTPWLWSLVPLSALWVNLHGGFVAWLAILGFLLAATAAACDWASLRRYTALAGLCGAATFLNPYGWRLHLHIAQYLTSSWILENVQEFQSPRIRSENLVVFAVLLLAGVALASRPADRHCWFETGLVLALAFAALRSARHVPLFAIVSAPAIASELARQWGLKALTAPPKAAVKVLWDLSRDLGKSRRLSPWMPAFCALALGATLSPAQLTDFPASQFPVAAVARNIAMPRVLTSDQWADYLIYRLYPRQRVFFDGRSDFYGPAIGRDYAALLGAAPGWRELVDRYGFETALLPMDWPLGRVLENDREWTVVYRDRVSLLLARRLKENPKTVEGCP